MYITIFNFVYILTSVGMCIMRRLRKLVISFEVASGIISDFYHKYPWYLCN